MLAYMVVSEHRPTVEATVIATMLRTTIYLDKDVALAIRQLADREQRSQAELIREALRRYLKQVGKRREPPKPSGIGAYRSGRHDVSERAEELLRQAARKNR